MICTMADVNVLNLCTLALQTLDCRVLSSNNNHNKFILFQRQRRPEYIKCKVTLLYHYDYIEIKASSCFHSFFFSKAIACTITACADNENNTITGRTGKVKISEVETRA